MYFIHIKYIIYIYTAERGVARHKKEGNYFIYPDIAHRLDLIKMV